MGTMEELHALLDRYTWYTTIPDIAGYKRIHHPVQAHCIFRGCTEPVKWVDARGEYFLCEGHYLTIRQWIGQARSGVSPGSRV